MIKPREWYEEQREKIRQEVAAVLGEQKTEEVLALLERGALLSVQEELSRLHEESEFRER